MSDRPFDVYVPETRSSVRTRGRPRRTDTRHRSPTPFALDESTSGYATAGSQDIVVIESDLEDQPLAGSSRRRGRRQGQSSHRGQDDLRSRSPPSSFARQGQEGASQRRSPTPTGRPSSAEYWTTGPDNSAVFWDDGSAEVPSSPLYRDWQSTRTQPEGSPSTTRILGISRMPNFNTTINLNVWSSATEHVGGIVNSIISAVSQTTAYQTPAPEVPDSTRQPHQGRQATSSRRSRTRNDANSSNTHATPPRRDRGSRGAPTSPEVQEIASLPPRAASAAARREAEECRPPMAGHMTSIEEGRLLVCASCSDQLLNQLFALQCGHVVCGGCVSAFREKKPCTSCGKKSSRRDAILQLYV